MYTILCFNSFFVAQVQTANIISAGSFFVAIASVIIMYYSLKDARQKFKNEAAEKLATKAYVMDKVSKPETSIELLRADLERNYMEHKEIKQEIIKHIDTRFDDLKLTIQLLHSKNKK